MPPEKTYEKNNSLQNQSMKLWACHYQSYLHSPVVYYAAHGVHNASLRLFLGFLFLLGSAYSDVTFAEYLFANLFSPLPTFLVRISFHCYHDELALFGFHHIRQLQSLLHHTTAFSIVREVFHYKRVLHCQKPPSSKSD